MTPAELRANTRWRVHQYLWAIAPGFRGLDCSVGRNEWDAVEAAIEAEIVAARHQGAEEMRAAAASIAHKFLNGVDAVLRADVLNDAAHIENAIRALPFPQPPQ